ncbi:helix-hairpin-helix domain-containing protein [Halococcoides cellulosivorans]|uniref:DNA polymerase beta n=1 Tax=Halococcoides cellulosivorans TaxID=1679096 RepID=A0A2R4WZ16_9EURY|nr:helix-hairpin-helix domain-containing protein [Halococcoides cellulosivorans]AWB26788.1 DNA polymerase/3'-5' exonuclease PolX [Halococcoides cellulosivorans]
MTTNDAVADRLEEFADRLEALEVEYKPRAYRRAAENVRTHPESVDALAREGTDAVGEIDRVGDAIAAKIVEFVETGAIDELEDLRDELPADIVALTRVEGVGPKTVGQLYDALGIETLDDLDAAAEAGEIQTVDGFGPTSEANIAAGIETARRASERERLDRARPRAEAIREYLAVHEDSDEVSLAGSIRRWKPTVGDVDVLVASGSGAAIVEAFTDWPEADRTIEAGDQKAAIESGGVRIDLRVVAPGEFGAATQYFTGSRDHNVDLRQRAIDRDWKLNEFGLFDVPGVEDDDQRAGERIAGEHEAAIYDALDLPPIEPELREGRGEIAAAADGELPDLIDAGDLRGDLHVHTDASDGDATIEEMARAAAERGLDYLGIADHAAGPGIVGGVGLSDDELRAHRDRIRELDDTVDIRLLAGVEANIAPDGTIGIDDDLLASLDVVVASPHHDLSGPGTDRLVAAAEHPHVDVIGHPTGAYRLGREGLGLDLDRLGQVAAEHDTALEVNANPRRLDLGGRAVRTVLEAGAQIVVNTDAHRPSALDLVRYGVHTARRGWAEADDVLNAQSVETVLDA